MVWLISHGVDVDYFFRIDVSSDYTLNARGVDIIKAFFEEYGLVLVVTVIATGMIFFSNEFKNTLRETLMSSWESMTEIQE